MLNYTEILNKLITNSNKKINLNANSVTRVLSVLSLLAHPQKSYKIINFIK